MDQDRDADSEVSLGRLEMFIGFHLRRVQAQLSRDFAAATAPHDLKSGFFSTLAIVSANPGISQTAICRTIGLDKSMTVQIVDEMERRGYAERKRSTIDRRQQSLFITESGEHFLDEMFVLLRKTEMTALQRVQPDELIMLHKILNRMYGAYQKPVRKV